MKKIFTFIAAIASVAFVASCAKELVPSKPSAPAEENTVTLVVDANIEAVEEESAQPVQADTRTVISGSTIKWSSSGEKITVYEKATTSGDVSMVSKASNVGSSSDSYVTMSFNVTMDSKTADNFTYYGSYPSSANVSTNKTQAKANLETKFAQTPVAASFDPSADLMISKSVDNDDAQATSLSMQFARVVAIGKMTITNLPVDEYVTKVTFSANNGSDVILAGRTNFDLETATPVTDYGDALAKTELSLNTSALSAKATSSMDVWFTCYPFELTTGDTFTVVVEAGAYQVSRTVTIPSARELNFEEGKVSRFSVDMSAADVAMQQPWVLYEGAITAGDYLIVSAGKAMKASVTSDRFDYTTVSAVDDEIYTNDATLVWRAAASSTYWTLYNPDSGMYAASTGAKNKAQLLDSGSDDMSLWSVTGDGTYEFVNKKNTANSVNANLRYNPGSGWACYGTGTGSASLLYKKDSRPYLATPASVTAALNGSDSSVIDVTFGTVANAGSYVIVAKTALDVTIIKEDVASSPATISVADGLAYNTEYTIAVYAVPSNPASYRNSLKKEAASTVTTGSAPTPSLGTMIWQEDFTGWTAFRDNVSGVSNVYGGGIVDYSTSASCTYQNDALAGGDKPEILISSNSAGQFIVKNLPIYKATSATLFYNTNYDYCSLSTSVGATVTAKSYNSVGPKVKVWEITSIPADTDLFDITLTNTNKDKNCRTDNPTQVSFQLASFLSDPQ